MMIDKNKLDVSSTSIFWTTDYGIFRFMRGNRDINERKVNKIISSVQSGMDLFKYNPIMVNEEMYIIDGQHRFTACMKLKSNVYFVIVPDFSLRQVAEINNNTTKWRSRDYLNCYMDTGNQHYVDLDTFIKDYQVLISVAVNLLYTGEVKGGGGSAVEVFKDGRFEIRYMDEAMALLQAASDYSDFCDHTLQRPFLQAIEVLLNSERYQHVNVIKKLRKHSLTIEKRSNYKDYLVAIEEAYNFRNSKRQVIY